ncbi:hypothetical protein S245_063216 [Arachis hypogaea]
MRALMLARLYEDKFALPPRNTYSPANHRTQFTLQNSTNSSRTTTRSSLPPLLPTPLQRPALTTTKNSIRGLTPNKIQCKREKGLCYWCDERFSVSHRCSNHLFMLFQLEAEVDIALVPNTDESTPDDAVLQKLDQEMIEHQFLAFTLEV